MKSNPINTIANMPFISRISPLVMKEIRQELRSRFLLLCLWSSTGILLTAYIIEAAELKNESMASMIMGGGAMESIYYFFCSICLFFIATGRASRNFTREMDAGSLDLLYLTGLRSFDIFLGKWIALGLQGLLIMTGLFPFAMIGYFMSGTDIPSVMLKSVGLYTLFLILISLSLADAAQDGTRGRGGRFGFTIAIITYLILTSTRFFSTMGSSSIYELILDQIRSPTGLLQLILTILAVVSGIRLTLHRGAASIAPPFENTVLLRRCETMLLASILCVISSGKGLLLLAASGLLAYFAYVGVITTANLVVEKQRKVVVDGTKKNQGRLAAIFRTGGWRGGTFVVLYICIITTIIQILSGIVAWRAMCTGIIIASSILASRFYLRIIETKRDSRMWDFILFQTILNTLLGIFSDFQADAPISPVFLFVHILQPTTHLSNSIIFAVFIHLLIVLAVVSMALFGPIEYRTEPLIEHDEPSPAMEATAND